MSTSWLTLELAAHRMIGRVRGLLKREAQGANVLGDPRVALAWLANELSHRSVTLAAGQVVTTGTCDVLLEVALGDGFVAELGVLGRVGWRFAAA